MNNLKNFCGALLLPALFALTSNAMPQRNAGAAWDADQGFEQASEQACEQACEQEVCAQSAGQGAVKQYSAAEWSQAQCAQQVECDRPLRGPCRTPARVTTTFTGRKSVHHDVEEIKKDRVTITKVLLLAVRQCNGEEEVFEAPIAKIPGYMPEKCWKEFECNYQDHADQCKGDNRGLGLKSRKTMEALPDQYQSIDYVMERIERDGQLFDKITFTTTATKEVVAKWEDDEGESEINEEDFRACAREINGDVGQGADECAGKQIELGLHTPHVDFPGSRRQKNM